MNSYLIKAEAIRSFHSKKNSSKKTFILISSLVFLLLACKDGSLNIPSESSDNAGADVSACLNGPAADYERIFPGPCELNPAEEQDGPADPSETISYPSLLEIITKNSTDESEIAELTAVIDCVAQAAYCIGESQCLTVASVCQFAVNCGSPVNPCENGTGPCNSNRVDNCWDVQSKNTCNESFTHSCFNSDGKTTQCDGAVGPVANDDYRNCYWGVDSETNKTGCFSYGSSYGDGSCVLSQ